MGQGYLQHLVVMPGVLHCDLSQWMTSVRAHGLMSQVLKHNTISRYTSFMGYIGQFAHIRLKKEYYFSGGEYLLIGRDVQLFAVPILCGFFLSVLAGIPSLRTVVVSSIASTPFTLIAIALYTVLALIYSVTPRAVYKSLRVWGFVDAECPFPSCVGTTPAQVYRFPHGWYDHVITKHAHNTNQPTRAMSSSASRTDSLRQSNSLIRTSLTPPEASANDLSSSGTIVSTPVTAGDGPQSGAQLDLAAPRVLDLCFPDYPADVLRQWKDLDFKPQCSDESLFHDFAKAYFTQRSENLGRVRQGITRFLLSWFSFTHLGIVQPVKFRIVKDYTGKVDKALCFEPLSTEELGPFLVYVTSHRYIASLVRSTWEKKCTGASNLGTQDLMGSPITAEMEYLARNKQPLPSAGYQGCALEFVETWDTKKLCLQLIAALILSTIVGIAVGLRTGSVEQGAVIAGLGVSISQLLVAGLILIITPFQK